MVRLTASYPFAGGGPQRPIPMVSESESGGGAMRWYQRFSKEVSPEKHLDAELRFHLEAANC
jgi:hypothetical protein